MRTSKLGVLSLTVIFSGVLASCGGGGSSRGNAAVPPISISISPASTTVPVNQTQQFTSTVTGGNGDTSVTWLVNGIQGGNSTVGTVSTSGLYTAPASVPNPASVNVVTTSIADSTESASATVKITPPVVTEQSLTTGPDGSASFSTINLTTSVSDIATGKALSGISVTLLSDGHYNGFIISDPAGQYAPQILITQQGVTSSLVAMQEATSIQANDSSTTSTIQVGLTSDQYITPSTADSTYPTTLFVDMWNYLLTDLGCGDPTPLSNLDPTLLGVLGGLANELPVEYKVGVIAFFTPIVEGQTATQASQDALTNYLSLPDLTELVQQGYWDVLYRGLGYASSDSFRVCKWTLPPGPGGNAFVVALPSDVPSGTPPPATASVKGTVTDANTGLAIPNVGVALVGGPSEEEVISPDGSFDFNNIAPGNYSLQAATLGYIPGGIKGFQVDAGGVAVEDIQLVQPGSIAITGAPDTYTATGAIGLLVTGSSVPVAGSVPGSVASTNGSGGNIVAYVPNGSFEEPYTGVKVVPIAGTYFTPTTIGTPEVVNSCSVDSAADETVCASNGTDIYVIQKDRLVATLNSGGSGTVTSSGGSCTTCGVNVDPTNTTAIVSISLSAGSSGYASVNLTNNTVSAPIPATGAYISESFGLLLGIPSFSHLLLSPTEADSGAPANYQIMNLSDITKPQVYNYGGGGTVFPSTADLDSAGMDSTGIILSTDEFTTDIFIADLTQARFTAGSGGVPGTWTAPGQLQDLPEFSTFTSGTTAIAIAYGAHQALLEDEYGTTAFGAIQLPSTSGKGTPAVQDWVVANMPNDPSGAAWQMTLDPHGVSAAFVALDGVNKGIGILVNRQRTYLAVIDLQALLSAPRTAPGSHVLDPNVDLLSTGIVKFVAIQ